MKNWPETRGEFLFGILVVMASTVTLVFLLRHANLPLILMEALFYLFMTGVAVVAYYSGKHAVHSMGMKPWVNYAWVYVVTCLLVLCLWGAHGTEVEWDLRSGANVVEESRKTSRESSEFAGRLFFGILPAALFGVYRGHKEKHEADLVELTSTNRF